MPVTPGYGAVFKSLDEPEPDESLTIERLSEEHATVRVSNGALQARCPAIWSASCPTTPAWSRTWWTSVWLVTGSEVVERLEVAARGQNHVVE